jgi:branched-subunit amino acid transport protein
MRLEILALIAGMTAVTFLPRFLPLALFSRWPVSGRLRAMLSFLPVAILSAIVFPAVVPAAEQGLAIEAPLLLAALVVFIYARWRKNLWGSVLVGMGSYWLLGMLF